MESTYRTRRRAWIFALSAALSVGLGALPSLAADSVKLGVLDDMSGVYADLAGKGSVLAARMAIEDFGPTVNGLPIELVSADHQNKADTGAAIARQWFDVDKVDVVLDILNSAVALAVEQVAKEKNKIVIATSVGAPDFSGKACTPTAILWTQDTYAITHSLAQALLKQGLDSWYFVAVDYSFGHSLVDDATSAIDGAGGKVLGAVYHPLNENDFSSYLLRAQASKAKVIAFANAGHDMTTAVKQAAEFGLTTGNQKLVALLVYNTDLHSLGLEAAQGLTFSSPFDADRNDASRAWSKRFFDRNGTMPTLAQASVYSAATHYLRAVAKAQSTDADKVVKAMRETPVNDFYASDAHIREDGVLVHDMYLMRAKKPAESRNPWDLSERLAVIPGNQAFRPLSESECPLVKHP
jgi:branched-chain amino acid transport system substrate-binding protein